MNPAANLTTELGLSSIVTKSVIDYFKGRGWLASGLPTLVANFLVNYLILLALTLIDSSLAGQSINEQFLITAASTVLSAYYHDLRKTLEK